MRTLKLHDAGSVRAESSGAAMIHSHVYEPADTSQLSLKKKLEVSKRCRCEECRGSCLAFHKLAQYIRTRHPHDFSKLEALNLNLGDTFTFYGSFVMLTVSQPHNVPHLPGFLARMA